MEIRRAQRKNAKLRLALIGPSGSGKTWSSLKIAKGIGDKILLIDTENGSGELYADDMGFEYDVVSIEAPYKPQKYIDAIKLGEANGYHVIIIDSLSHAWAGEGGLLDQQGHEADRTNNAFSAWRKVTPQHNELVGAMLSSSAHILATIRAKTEYVQEVDNKGKYAVKKVGLAPIQRDGLEYEFTVVFDIGTDHRVSVSKDRTNMFENVYLKADTALGEKLKAWLESGIDGRRLELEAIVSRIPNSLIEWRAIDTDAQFTQEGTELLIRLNKALVMTAPYPDLKEKVEGYIKEVEKAIKKSSKNT